MKTLSIIIPVYNEAQRLDITFKALKKSLSFYGIKVLEVIFVNDGSTDKTLKLLKSRSSKLRTNTRIISYKQNRGKGYAVRKGMLAASADYALLVDADMSAELSELKKFKKYFEKNASVIIGTRKNSKAKITKSQPLIRQYLGKFYTLLSQIILNVWVSDFTCGFKAFDRQSRYEIFSRAQVDRWAYDSEILFLAKNLGYAIQEVSVSWKHEEGTKVRVGSDGIQSFWDLLKVRFNSYQEISLAYERQ